MKQEQQFRVFMATQDGQMVLCSDLQFRKIKKRYVKFYSLALSTCFLTALHFLSTLLATILCITRQAEPSEVEVGRTVLGAHYGMNHHLSQQRKREKKVHHLLPQKA
jgi:hypothetical protein